jgi:hypothetical protein
LCVEAGLLWVPSKNLQFTFVPGSYFKSCQLSIDRRHARLRLSQHGRRSLLNLAVASKQIIK